MTDIERTLQERGDRYGSFEHHAKIAQDLQRVMHAESGWANLADDQRQALTVIMDKVARMLNGDPAYRDNWHDIVGYAKLVDDRMKRDDLEVFRANEAKVEPVPVQCPGPEWHCHAGKWGDTMVRKGAIVVLQHRDGTRSGPLGADPTGTWWLWGSTPHRLPTDIVAYSFV